MYKGSRYILGIITNGQIFSLSFIIDIPECQAGAAVSFLMGQGLIPSNLTSRSSSSSSNSAYSRMLSRYASLEPSHPADSRPWNISISTLAFHSFPPLLLVLADQRGTEILFLTHDFIAPLFIQANATRNSKVLGGRVTARLSSGRISSQAFAGWGNQPGGRISCSSQAPKHQLPKASIFPQTDMWMALRNDQLLNSRAGQETRDEGCMQGMQA